jgi:hypothetical protein
MAFWIASFVCLLAMNVTVRRSEQLTLGFLFGFGLLVGWPRHRRSPTTPTSIPSRSGRPAGRRRCLSPASVLAATRRDLSALARVLCWALIALIAFGVVLIFVSILGSSVAYALLGLVTAQTEPRTTPRT